MDLFWDTASQNGFVVRCSRDLEAELTKMGFHVRKAPSSRFLCTYNPSVAEKIISRVFSPQVSDKINRIKGDSEGLLRAATKLIGTPFEVSTALKFRVSVIPQVVALSEAFKDQTHKSFEILQSVLTCPQDYGVPETEFPEIVARLAFTAYFDRLLPDILVSISSSTYWLTYGPQLRKIDHPEYFQRIQNSIANNTFHSVLHSPVDLFLSLSDLYFAENGLAYKEKAEIRLTNWFGRRLKAMRQYDADRMDALARQTA